MANPNALIVEVVGDTRKLTKGLRDAERQMKSFARSTRDPRSGPAGKMLGEIDQMNKALDALPARQAEVIRNTEMVNARMAKFGIGVGIAGLAVNRLGANFQEMGGEAGKFGDAISKLSSGNLVGFYFAANNAKEAAKNFGQELLAANDYAKANQKANLLAAAGLDDLAKAARGAADEIAALDQAKRQLISFDSIQGTFGVTPLDPLLGKKPPKTRPGISRDQRNTFFDDAIARQLDRAKDRVSKLRQVAAELQKEIAARDDITRKNTLRDRLFDVEQRIEQIQTNAAKEAARLAKERADAEARRLAELKRAAQARQQARDDLALGLQTPGVGNLRKQLAQLTARSDINSIPNKLAASLDGARRILNRKWDTISEDSRSNIASLFETIRDALNEGATGGPLTKTTQLSERILAGLGLSAADERTLKARLSHFNSAGTALTGSGSGSAATFVSNTVIDGKVVATTSSKYNRRARTVNTAARNGPNAGAYVGA